MRRDGRMSTHHKRRGKKVRRERPGRIFKMTKDDFKKYLKEIGILLGMQAPPPEATVDLFFEKLKHHDVRDWVKASKDDEMLDELSRRRGLNYPIIRQAIERQMVKREGLEWEQEKRQREAEARAFCENED